MTKQNGSILIVDDDEDVLMTARMILRPHYKQINTSNSTKTIERDIKENHYDVVILDMNFKTGATSGNEGLFWLRQIRNIDPEVHVIMNTAYGDIQLAVECMKEGAIDFLVKPWEKEKLLSTVHNVFELKKSKQKIRQLSDTKETLSSDIEQHLGELIGKSDAMKAVFDTVKKVAKTDANVLILGENGTGKELVARAIHKLSKRSDHNFVKVDLGALSESLFESELFGHVKGAFTDAKENRTGRFEIANEGTLFLDEIGNISPSQQIKLLTVLQSRQVTRVGSGKAVDVDIRLICATNKEIHKMADGEEFRQDLLYRINTIELPLPPLRERKGDISLLLNHFLEVYSKKYEKGSLRFEPNAVAKLEEYDWPGNVRELQHAVERAVILSEGEKLSSNDFLVSSKKKITKSDTLKVEDLEKEAIAMAIEKCGGNLSKAADELGMGRSTLYRKMEKYKI